MKQNLAVAAVVTRPDGKVLLMQRGSKARTQHGCWENTGGAVERAETPKQAIVREAREELGVELEVDKILLDYILDQESALVVWRTIVFKAEIASGDPRIMEPGVCTDVRWVRIDELVDLPLTTYAREDFVRLGWL